MVRTPGLSRNKLLSAAIDVFRRKGYAATTVDDICAEAGVTKGSFFHHFKTKEDLTLQLVEHWNTWTAEIFRSAPYQQLDDPLARVLGYVDFRIAILGGEIAAYTCLLGTLVQEVHATHPDVRAACEAGLNGHIEELLLPDIEAARARHAPNAEWSAASVGYFIQSVLQGSFIFVKACQGPDVARENLAHLRRYLTSLFTPAPHP
ncbi:MAG: TetR/AcrR family transcriptional regulator [Uliginosibacterium sp.]|jgi:TetR/AcrR family transcriptional repressor of nem operon|nr:TetR/AcrR family transcriptional regulator [Uliginosibacterium sp.]